MKGSRQILFEQFGDANHAPHMVAMFCVDFRANDALHLNGVDENCPVVALLQRIWPSHRSTESQRPMLSGVLVDEEVDPCWIEVVFQHLFDHSTRAHTTTLPTPFSAGWLESKRVSGRGIEWTFASKRRESE